MAFRRFKHRISSPLVGTALSTCVSLCRLVSTLGGLIAMPLGLARACSCLRCGLPLLSVGCVNSCLSPPLYAGGGLKTATSWQLIASASSRCDLLFTLYALLSAPTSSVPTHPWGSAEFGRVCCERRLLESSRFGLHIAARSENRDLVRCSSSSYTSESDPSAERQNCSSFTVTRSSRGSSS